MIKSKNVIVSAFNLLFLWRVFEDDDTMLISYMWWGCKAFHWALAIICALNANLYRLGLGCSENIIVVILLER